MISPPATRILFSQKLKIYKYFIISDLTTDYLYWVIVYYTILLNTIIYLNIENMNGLFIYAGCPGPLYEVFGIFL